MNEPLLKAGAHWPLAFNSSGGGIARLFLTVMLMVVSLCAAAQGPSAYETRFESDGGIGLQSATEFDTPNGRKDRIRLSNATQGAAWSQDNTGLYFCVSIGSTAKFSIPSGYVVEKIEFYAENIGNRSTAYTAGMNSTLTVSGGSNGNYTLTNPNRKT